MRIEIDGQEYETDDMDPEDLADLEAHVVQFGASGITAETGSGTVTIGNLHAGNVSFGNGNHAGGVYYEGEEEDR